MLATVFFAGSSKISAGFFVLAVIILSVLITLIISKLLSMTLLKGMPSSFTLELPPYRRPKIGQVIVRSILDRTIFVLGRAVSVAAPAGAIIWLMQNIMVGDSTLIGILANFLDPLGQLMGMSGLILAAFLLGIPANEIVIPILLMCYMQGGSLIEMSGATQMAQLLQQNGWTALTALCTVLFSLNHFPCTTTLLTIHKETGSWKWTVAAFLIPTAVGIAICCAVNGIYHLFTLV